jgi:hypothetical protein
MRIGCQKKSSEIFRRNFRMNSNSNTGTYPGGPEGSRQEQMVHSRHWSSLIVEQEQESNRQRSKLSSYHHHHHHHPSSVGVFNHKYRQTDSRRGCTRRRDLSRQQHASDMLSRGQQQIGAFAAGNSSERVTSLLNDIGALDCLSTGAWRDKNQFRSDSSDLESRFWTDCSDGRSKASCSTSTTAAGDFKKCTAQSDSGVSAPFATLPFDILRRIAGSFSWPNLWSASRVCKGWGEALEPLRQAMLFVHHGKKLKHGRGGYSRNLDKALDSFLKGAARGCAAAMVDAGLLLWETVSLVLVLEPAKTKAKGSKYLANESLLCQVRLLHSRITLDFSLT